MISLVEPGDTRLGMAPGEPLLLAMVQGLAKPAGPGLRREVWLVLDEESRPAGAVCRTEGGLWATAAGSATAETAAFLAVLGGSSAMVDGGLVPLLPGSWQRRPVLEYRGPQPEETLLCPPSAMGLLRRGGAGCALGKGRALCRAAPAAPAGGGPALSGTGRKGKSCRRGGESSGGAPRRNRLPGLPPGKAGAGIRDSCLAGRCSGGHGRGTGPPFGLQGGASALLHPSGIYPHRGGVGAKGGSII